MSPSAHFARFVGRYIRLICCQAQVGTGRPLAVSGHRFRGSQKQPLHRQLFGGQVILDHHPTLHGELTHRIFRHVDAGQQQGFHFSRRDVFGHADQVARLGNVRASVYLFQQCRGLGIRYRDEEPPTPTEYLKPLLERFTGRDEALCFEPGRSLVGNAGLLLTRIEYLKPGVEKNFAIIDAAMNDLARPALYDAYHEIVAVAPRSLPATRYEVVGPICESGDFLGHDRDLAVDTGDLLAILSAGAYGMTMSSNYNTRPRAAEVLVDGDTVHVIRERETLEHLLRGERPLP